MFGLKIVETLGEVFAQEKKIRIATVDRCVMCGEIIPEGKQVCGLCKISIERARWRGQNGEEAIYHK